MIKRFFIFSLCVISVLFIYNSCDGDPLNPKEVNAVVVILGRHANANAFSDSYYEDGLRKHIRNTVYGGYVGVIIGDGNPRVIERFDFFKTEAKTTRERDNQIARDTDLIMDFLMDEGNRAEAPENNLLKAIQEANNLLNIFEGRARDAGRNKINKQIIIMDTGIVTAGDMDFYRLGIDNILFSKSSDEQINTYSQEIVEILERNRALLDLSGVNIVFIGMGDVALPQGQLSNHVMHGIEIIWRAVFSRFNVSNSNIDIDKNLTSGNIANETRNGFPFVTPIVFEQPAIEGIITIPMDQVSFIANRADFLDPVEAEIILNRFAGVLIRYLNRNPEIIIYVVGSMARTSLDRDAPIELSENRAITVMETLIKYGVPKEKLVAFGLGEFYPNRQNEFPRGVFVEEIARHNRKVVLIPDNFTNEVRDVLNARERLAGRR